MLPHLSLMHQAQFSFKPNTKFLNKEISYDYIEKIFHTLFLLTGMCIKTCSTILYIQINFKNNGLEKLPSMYSWKLHIIVSNDYISYISQKEYTHCLHFLTKQLLNFQSAFHHPTTTTEGKILFPQVTTNLHIIVESFLFSFFHLPLAYNTLYNFFPWLLRHYTILVLLFSNPKRHPIFLPPLKQQNCSILKHVLSSQRNFMPYWHQ